jgi:hypothetical protein
LPLRSVYSVVRLMRLLSLIVLVAVATGACRSASSDPVDSPAGVRVSVEVDYNLDRPPLAADATNLEPADADGWATHEIEIRRAQSEWTVAAEIRGTSYRAVDDALTVIARRKASPVLFADDEVSRVAVVLPEPLASGVHTFELSIPVWLTAIGGSSGRPDDVVTLRLRYDVRNPVVSGAVGEFCDVAVTLLDGRVPTPADLEGIVAVAAADLAAGDAAAIAEEAAMLAGALARPTGGFSTRELTTTIENLCNVTMFWIAGTP